MNDFIDLENEREVVEEQDSGIWLSISDLMSGLLMFFALLFITVQVQLQEKMQQLEKVQVELQEKIEELDKYQKWYNALSIEVQNTLKEKLGNKYSLKVDPKTGDVSVGNRILFDEGSAKLKPEGKQFLKEFIPLYSQVIFSDKQFDRYISRVIIEGHTSSKGSDTGNMELSLRRALSVSNYIFSKQLNFPNKKRLKQKIISAGRGEIDAEQKFDKPSDRKVVFRFQFVRQDFERVLQKQNDDKK